MFAGSAFKIRTWAELVTELGTGPIFAGEEGKLVFCVWAVARELEPTTIALHAVPSSDIGVCRPEALGLSVGVEVLGFWWMGSSASSILVHAGSAINHERGRGGDGSRWLLLQL
jgi:hypothetical protein